MTEILEDEEMAFEDIPFLQYLGNAVDILLVWYVIYKLIMVIRGTKAVQLLKGIVVIVLVRMASQYLGLSTLQWLMDQAITWGFLAIIINPDVSISSLLTSLTIQSWLVSLK